MTRSGAFFVHPKHIETMVVGYHVIFGAYSFWLPNDPRGSWSDYVGARALLRFGKATKVSTRRSLAGRRHDVNLRHRAKEVLKYPAVRFTGVQARAVGRGFGDYAEKSALAVWACAVLPDHVHLVMGRHRLAIEQVANQLKGAATRQLNNENIHPFREHRLANGRCPKVFAGGQWAVFLNTDDDVDRAIRYVEHNPTKEELPTQRWSFVVPYPGGAPHAGRG